MTTLHDYLLAEGPEDLQTRLNDLFEKTQQDPLYAERTHYVLYQLGNQKSVIKVDTSQIPFKFAYYDLMGRPATLPVKEIITRFLSEKCGVKEAYDYDQTENNNYIGSK